MYETFKASVLGKPILTVQGITNPYGIECVTLDWAYANALWPNISIKQTISLGNANTLFNNSSSTHFTKILNDHSNPNQLPVQGDIMVFAGTPATGYTDQFNNPDGHTGVCDSASSAGYFLLAQNSPKANEAPNVTFFAWKYRPCIGWLRPIVATLPAEEFYTVVKGDTVWGISEKFGLSVANDCEAFRVLNPQIPNIAVISVGEKVRVK